MTLTTDQLADTLRDHLVAQQNQIDLLEQRIEERDETIALFQDNYRNLGSDRDAYMWAAKELVTLHDRFTAGFVEHGDYEDAELKDYRPAVVFVDGANRMVRPPLAMES